MFNPPFVSIIIPTWRDSDVLAQCLASLVQLEYPTDRFEVILLSQEDLAPNIKSFNVSVVKVEKNVGYAEARNRGAGIAKGDIIAFIDDDCVVPKDWLEKGVRYFADSSVSLVGGPALPFVKDSLRHRIGGYIFGNFFAVGAVRSRYSINTANIQPVRTGGEHLIMANNLVRKDVFMSASGLDPDQVPCEDGYFYARLASSKNSLLYSPEAFVWHRAKPVFLPIFSKVFYYAIGRGGLIARSPRLGKPAYLLPSFALIFVISLGVLSFLYTPFRPLLFAVLAVYFLANLTNSLIIFFTREPSLKVFFSMFISVPFVHASYAVGVLYGIFLYFTGKFKNGGIAMWNKD